MKRIVFSIFTDDLNPGHSSSSDYKLSQFKKYKKQLYKAQKEYAMYCGASYILVDARSTDYDEIQFDKLILLEEFADNNNEVLYLDFDVVPNTKVNFFEAWDLNSICAYNIEQKMDREALLEAITHNMFDAMNMYNKFCAKTAMLSLDDATGSSGIINTGVIAGNKKSLSKLNFLKRLDEMKAVLHEAKTNNIYPDEICKHWKNNNEIFVTYLIEKYNVPFKNIGLQWNFLLDHNCPDISAGSHFVHHVNKDFHISFG